MAKNAFDELMSIRVDIGKDTFHLVGFDQAGQRVLRKQIKRLALVAIFEKLPRCVLGMEACLSAHFVRFDDCMTDPPIRQPLPQRQPDVDGPAYHTMLRRARCPV